MKLVTTRCRRVASASHKSLAEFQKTGKKIFASFVNNKSSVNNKTGEKLFLLDAHRKCMKSDLTSYTRFSIFKMASMTTQLYFRLRIWWRQTLRSEICLQTKFWRDVSIHGRDITISGFWKQTVAIFKIYFRLPLWRFDHHRHAILRRSTNFHPNRTVELWRHRDFQDGCCQPCWIWLLGNGRRLRTYWESPSLIVKFRLDRIYFVNSAFFFC